MKNTSIFKSGLLLVAATTLMMVACKKTNDNTSSSSLTTADDNGGYASDAAKLETTNNDVISIADVAGTTNSGSTLRTTGTTLSPCATVTNDTTVTPHVLTINFGTTDCICADYKNRRGEIIVTYTGHYKDSGSTHTITYNNYFVNDNQVMGSKTVQNMGTNGSGQVYYTVTVNDSMVIGTDSVITWTGSRTRTWLEGYSTPERSDDVYQVTGTTTLKRANGHTFTLDITSPLYIALSCPYIESGIINITGSTLAVTRTLNYGTAGSCDDEAQLTIGSHTYNITLH
jgi:hypothetical protein